MANVSEAFDQAWLLIFVFFVIPFIFFWLFGGFIAGGVIVGYEFFATGEGNREDALGPPGAQVDKGIVGVVVDLSFSSFFTARDDQPRSPRQSWARSIRRVHPLRRRHRAVRERHLVHRLQHQRAWFLNRK